MLPTQNTNIYFGPNIKCDEHIRVSLDKKTIKATC